MSTTRNIDLKDAERYFGQLSNEFAKAALAGLRSAALRGVAKIQTEIIPNRTPQPVDRGIFRSGWRSEILPDGATIENNEPHAVFIEEGVRAANVKPGLRMILALAEWAMRKGIASNMKEAMGRAWAIAKTAQRRGIFNGGIGYNILGELVDAHLPTMIQEEVAREIERIG